MYTDVQRSVLQRVVELFHPVGHLEELWQRVVQSTDKLVYRLLPRLFLVFVGGDRVEELAQRRLNRHPEVVGHLEEKINTFKLVKL